MSVVSSIVLSVGTGKLVCNKPKSILTESFVNILSRIKVTVVSAGTNKKVCINRVSIITKSVVTLLL